MNLGIDIYSLILIAAGLAMDAFSVATITGFSLSQINYKLMVRLSTAFGFFHILMPILGWFAGLTVLGIISWYDHWLAFLLLLIVGGRMIFEAVKENEPIDPSKVLGGINLAMVSVAVSIDALAVGLSFYLERVAIFFPSIVLGIITFLFTFGGVLIGNHVGPSLGKKVKIGGGVILILIGIRIVFTHIF